MTRKYDISQFGPSWCKNDFRLAGKLGIKLFLKTYQNQVVDQNILLANSFLEKVVQNRLMIKQGILYVSILWDCFILVFIILFLFLLRDINNIFYNLSHQLINQFSAQWIIMSPTVIITSNAMHPMSIITCKFGQQSLIILCYFL